MVDKKTYSLSHHNYSQINIHTHTPSPPPRPHWLHQQPHWQWSWCECEGQEALHPSPCCSCQGTVPCRQDVAGVGSKCESQCSAIQTQFICFHCAFLSFVFFSLLANIHRFCGWILLNVYEGRVSKEFNSFHSKIMISKSQQPTYYYSIHIHVQIQCACTLHVCPYMHMHTFTELWQGF